MFVGLLSRDSLSFTFPEDVSDTVVGTPGAAFGLVVDSLEIFFYLVPEVKHEGIGIGAESREFVAITRGILLELLLREVCLPEILVIYPDEGDGGAVDGSTAGAGTFLLAFYDFLAPVDEILFGDEGWEFHVPLVKPVEGASNWFQFAADDSEVEYLQEMGDI